MLSDEPAKLTTMLTSLSKLGTVATHVINATQHNLVSSLKSLSPVVEQLTAAGSNLSRRAEDRRHVPVPAEEDPAGGQGRLREPRPSTWT